MSEMCLVFSFISQYPWYTAIFHLGKDIVEARAAEAPTMHAAMQDFAR